MNIENPEKVIESIPDDVKEEVINFITKVLQIEGSKLHMGNPRNINEELIRALEETVK